MKKVLFFLVIFGLLIVWLTSRIAQSEKVEKVDMHLTKNEAAVTFLDFSSGEATLVQNGFGDAYLFNTGGPKTTAELEDHFELYKVKTVKTVFVLNEEQQYTGNLKWLINEKLLEEIVAPQPVLEALKKEFSEEEVKLTSWQESELHELFPGMIIKVLAAQDEVDLKPAGYVFSLRYGNNHFLMMGITSPEIEQQLLESSYPLKAEIIKVANFAESGSTENFIDEVDPQAAIIFNKKHAYPSQEIIERLHETWIDIYHTRQFGNISLKCSMESYEIITIPIKNARDEDGK